VTIAQATIGAKYNDNNDSHARYSGLYTLMNVCRCLKRDTHGFRAGKLHLWTGHIFYMFYTHHYVNVVSDHRLSLT